MTTSTENDRVKTLISDTLTLLCKNGLQFKSEFSIAATIGITLDKTNVILVSINDIVHTESSVDEREDGADTDKKSLHDEESPKRKRRKIKQRKRTPSISDAEDEQTYPMDEDIVLVKTEEPEDEQTWPVDNGGDADYQDNVLLQGSSQVSSHPLTGSQLNPDDACFEDGSMQLTAVDPTSSESQVHKSLQITSTSKKQKKKDMKATPNIIRNIEEVAVEFPSEIFDSDLSQEDADTTESSEPQADSQIVTYVLYDSNPAESASSKKVNPRYQCTYEGCVYCTNIKTNYDKHLKTHTKEYMKCSECSSKFTTKYDLKEHYLFAHTAEKLPCTKCSAKFTSRQGLVKHFKARHTEQKSFVCETCGKGYDHRILYNVHVKSHMIPPKKLPCSSCGKTFSTNSNLRRHERQCRNIEPMFKCEECGDEFRQKSSLEVHVNSVHKGILHACQCGKSFAWEKSLKKHQKKDCFLTKQVPTDSPKD